MSHLYNLKFDQMRNNAPEKDGGAESVVFYTAPAQERKICFVLLDGNRLLLSYGFMISCEYLQDHERVILEFTSHTITLSGLGLEKLFESLDQHMPQRIICKDERYNALAESGKPVVNKIEVASKSE